MAYTPANWSLDSYVNATWTDVVAEVATIASVVISNTGAGAVVVQMRVDDGAGVNVAQVVPEFSIAADESYTLDVRSLNITGSQRLQFQADTAGAEVFVSGVTSD